VKHREREERVNVGKSSSREVKRVMAEKSKFLTAINNGEEKSRFFDYSVVAMARQKRKRTYGWKSESIVKRRS